MKSMNTLFLRAIVALACAAGTSFGAASYQPLVVGATYTMEEDYSGSITFGNPGDEVQISGTIDIDADTEYEVVGSETYQQTNNDPNAGSYTVFKVHYTGTANLDGLVDLTASFSGINLTGNDIGLRLLNARFDGYLWLREGDLALVAKKREIAGVGESNAQLNLLAGGLTAGPNWNVLAPVLEANQFEEYVPPLEDYRWPLDTSNPSYTTNPLIYAFGDYHVQYSAFGLVNGELDDTFDTNMNINFTHTVPSTGSEDVAGKTVNYYKCSESTDDFGQPASQNYYYSPELRFILRQEIVNLAIGGLLNLNNATLQVVDYAGVPDVTPTPETPTPTATQNTPTPSPTGGTPTPNTPTPTPTGGTPSPTPTGAGCEIWADVSQSGGSYTHTVDLNVYNNTPNSITMSLYVALELGGQFLFFPTFGPDAVAVVPSVDFPGSLSLGRFNLFTLPNYSTTPLGVTVTWYAALIDLGSGSVLGGLQSDSADL